MFIVNSISNTNTAVTVTAKEPNVNARVSKTDIKRLPSMNLFEDDTKKVVNTKDIQRKPSLNLFDSISPNPAKGKKSFNFGSPNAPVNP